MFSNVVNRSEGCTLIYHGPWRDVAEPAMSQRGVPLSGQAAAQHRGLRYQAALIPESQGVYQSHLVWQSVPARQPIPLHVLLSPFARMSKGDQGLSVKRWHIVSDNIVR